MTNVPSARYSFRCLPPCQVPTIFICGLTRSVIWPGSFALTLELGGGGGAFRVATTGEAARADWLLLVDAELPLFHQLRCGTAVDVVTTFDDAEFVALGARTSDFVFGVAEVILTNWSLATVPVALSI